jgi:DNA replication factor GINS
MDLDELRSVQSRERQASQLQHLRDGFYEEAASFIRGLRTERERAAANSEYSFPYDDPEVQRLTDEIQTAEEVVESLYERRVGKVVKMASFDAAGMAVDAEGLTAEESELFETLVGDIEANRGRVLDALAGTSGDGAGPGTSAGTPADATTGTADDGRAASGAPEGPDRADAPAGAGDREPEAPTAEDEGEDGPVHIGSGPAADGPVSTADDAGSENASPPGQPPTPGTGTPEADAEAGSAAEPEPTPDTGHPAPRRESSGGGSDPRDGSDGADPAGDAMDAASAMGGVGDETGDAASPGGPDGRSGDAPDGGASPERTPPETQPADPQRAGATETTADAAAGTTADDTAAGTTADATADTAADPGTDGAAGEAHQPVPPADGPPGPDPGPADDTTSREPSPTPDADPTAGAPAGEPSTDAGTAGRSDTGGTDESGTTGTLVQVTADVGEIFGVDGRAYDLAAGDVAVLPADNAELLVADGEAERLDSTIPFDGHSNRS